MRALTQYAEKRFSRLQHLLESVKDPDDPEILHQIRLEIKKVKALLGLIHFNYPTLNTHKIYIPLRTIFRKAGKVREPWVMENLLSSYGIDPVLYKTVLPPKKSVHSLRKRVSVYLKNLKRAEKKIRKKINRIDKEDLRKYLKKHEQELAKKLFPEFDSATLHHSRKLIKEILYLSTIRKKKKQLPCFFSESADLIGEWNDKQVIIQLLKKSGLPHSDVTQKLKQVSEKELLTLTKLVTDYYTLQ